MNKNILIFFIGFVWLSFPAEAGRWKFFQPSTWGFRTVEVEKSFVPQVMSSKDMNHSVGLISVLGVQHDMWLGYMAAGKVKLKEAGFLSPVSLNKKWQREMDDVASELATAIALDRLAAKFPNENEVETVVSDTDDREVLPVQHLRNFDALVKEQAKARLRRFAKTAYLTPDELKSLFRQAEEKALVELSVSKKSTKAISTDKIVQGIDDYLAARKDKVSGKEELAHETRTLIYDIAGFFIRTPVKMCKIGRDCVSVLITMYRSKKNKRKLEKEMMRDIPHL